MRQTERHIAHDPADPAELEELAADVRGLIDAELSGRALVSAAHGIAVAGTPTSLAAIDLELDPYDAEAVTATSSTSRRSSTCARSSRR